MDRRIKSGDDTVRDDRAARAAPAGLTMLQRGAEFCTDPEQAERDQQKWNPVFASDRAVKNIEGAHDLIAKPLTLGGSCARRLHQFKTTGRGLLRHGESPLSDLAHFTP
jgi:hypothetical protein